MGVQHEPEGIITLKCSILVMNPEKTPAGCIADGPEAPAWFVTSSTPVALC